MDTRTKAYEVYLYLTEDLKKETCHVNQLRQVIEAIWGTRDLRQHKGYIEVMESEGWIEELAGTRGSAYKVNSGCAKPLCGRQRREQLRAKAEQKTLKPQTSEGAQA